MDQSNIYTEQRPWGNFERFTHNENATVKIITVTANEALSLQSHTKRDEFWKVLSGAGTVELNDMSIPTEPGSTFSVPRGTKHRVTAGPDGIQFLEIATGEFDEHDIIRYDDRYGRASSA
ncbi:MAG: putative mannose-phosphate guanylyltransferase/mannose-6-phosphate isomerase [Candidatus Adlerbacteria bacterium]|nr:putative mannose-phosphate guanylyltransferase/mannose-6-phosphate isomerase [Candidatus Adlerbacteria bacterium]